MRNTEAYTGCLVRLVRDDEFRSPSNPGGFVRPQPQLVRQRADLDISYGEQALEHGVIYMYCGCADGRTLVFVNQATNMAVQLFRTDLPSACFVLQPQS